MSEKRLSDIIHHNIPLSKKFYNSNAVFTQINEDVDSGVLVIIHFSKPSVPVIIFTKRSTKLRNHGGEISFPGGRFCKKDGSLIETAIRETHEEIGLKLSRGSIVGCLNPTNTYTTKILIYPFVVVLSELTMPLTPNEEVEEILEISLDKLISSIEVDKEHTLGNCEMFKFQIDGILIWGATARILKNLIDVIMRGPAT